MLGVGVSPLVEIVLSPPFASDDPARSSGLADRHTRHANLPPTMQNRFLLRGKVISTEGDPQRNTIFYWGGPWTNHKFAISTEGVTRICNDLQLYGCMHCIYHEHSNWPGKCFPCKYFSLFNIYWFFCWLNQWINHSSIRVFSMNWSKQSESIPICSDHSHAESTEAISQSTKQTNSIKRTNTAFYFPMDVFDNFVPFAFFWV